MLAALLLFLAVEGSVSPQSTETANVALYIAPQVEVSAEGDIETNIEDSEVVEQEAETARILIIQPRAD